MKTIRNILFVLCTLFYLISNAQSSKDVPPKLRDRIAGVWTIQKIYSGTKEITPDQTASPQTLKFDLEGHYTSSVGQQTIDSGSYRISESAKLLYLENKKLYNTASQNSSQATWMISFKNETMTMRGQGNETMKKLRYVYVKQQ